MKQLSLEEFYNTLCNNNKPVLAPASVIKSQTDVQITADSTVATILGGAVGAFLLPMVGGSWVIGAMLGASLGYRMGNMPNNDDKKRPKKYAQSYTFSGDGGSLAELGSPIPLIYCNKRINPSGGVRYSGNLICSHIETKLNSGNLHQLYAVSVGEIKEVSTNGLLINQQPMNNFYNDEIKIDSRPGLPSQATPTGVQTTLSNFTFFSQTVAPQSNSTLGCDKRAKVKGSYTSAIGQRSTWTSFYNSYNNGNSLIKNGGDSTTYSASALGSLAITEVGSSFSFITPETNTARMAGLTVGSANENMDFGVSILETGIYEVRESGTVKFTSTTPIVPNEKFSIDISASGTLTYSINGTIFYTSSNTPSFPLYPAAALKTVYSTIHDARVIAASTGVSGGVDVSTSSTTVIKLDESQEENYGDYDRFIPSDTYAVVNVGGYQEFRVIEKPTLDSENYVKELKVAPGIVIKKKDEIFAIYRARYETTKRVSELHINLEAVCWARPKPSQEEMEGGKGGKK